jgi:hypothetical protein
LNRRINQLGGIGKNNQLDSTAKSLLLAWLECACKGNEPTDSPRVDKATQPVDPNSLNVLRDWLKKSGEALNPVVTDKIPDPNKWLSDFRNELNSIKKNQVAKPTQKARFTEGQFLNPKTPASIALRAKIDKLKLPWGTIELILSHNHEVKQQAIAELLGGGGLAELDSVANTLRDFFDNRTSFRLTIVDPDHTDATKGADAARLCLDHYYQNFLICDLITYPVQYGTNSGEANVVHVYRVSPEDAPSIMEERAGVVREKLAGRALMSFGAFLDESWRKNDMLWGRLDGAERLISVLLPDDTPERKNLIYRAHLGILREEILQGNGDAVCRLLSNARAHSHKKLSDDEHVEDLVQAILNDEALARYMTEERHGYLVAPQKFDRDLEAETALKYISRSTNITGNMLQGLADQYRFNGGKHAANWITRLGATFWNMIAVAAPQSLGNIFFRHWLGLLYLFSAVVILTGILFKSVSSLGWQLLGATVSLNLVTWLLGNFIAGKRHWVRAVRRIGIAIVATLIGFGAYFISTKSPALLANHDELIGAITGLAVLILLGFAEWRRWLKDFLSAPTATFSYSTLFLLTVATFAALGILLWIGPKEIAGLEFARTAPAAARFLAQTTVPKLRFQLGADFLFIVAYAAMLTSYCVAGAKLFWQRRQNVASKLEEKRRAIFAQSEQHDDAGNGGNKESVIKASWQLQFLCGLVVAGFAFAGLQWIAAFADATENVGLLFYLNEYLKEHPEVGGLEIAYWAATLKFLLVALGGAYAVVAFIFGAWNKIGLRTMSSTWRQILLRVVFVLVSLSVIGIACNALLVCRPHPENCLPPPKQELSKDLALVERLRGIGARNAKQSTAL